MSLLSILTGNRRPSRKGGTPDPVPPLARVTPGAVRSGDAASDAPAQRQSAEVLHIPSPVVSGEEDARDIHRQHGQFLARQDRWDDLVAEMARADAARDTTPAGMPVAELLCFGARADVVMAVEHALSDENAAGTTPLISGIEALEHMLADHPACAFRAATVAQAHMDIGWTWRGTVTDAQVPEGNREAFEAHFDRAAEILRSYRQHSSRSPLIRAAFCALHGRGTGTTDDLVRDYETLIDLHPDNPAPMRSLGAYLSPRWFGSHERLELEARKTAARLTPDWGAGGYTWVMMDALADDDNACAQLDLEFFIEGLHDILDRRPDQHTVNLLAAWCAVSLGRQMSGHTRADTTRKAVAGCCDWIVRGFMTEMHPLIWAHAAQGFDNNISIGSPRRFASAGETVALRTIRSVFDTEISAGKRISFTADGPVTAPV